MRSQDYTTQKCSQEVHTQSAISESQEQYSRRNCLLLHGVAEAEGENTDSLVINTAKKRLVITLKPYDLDRSHRLGAPRADGRASPIIAKFSRYNVRSTVYSAKKKLKGTKLLVTESLTRQRVGVLADAKRKYGMRNVWTIDGEFFTKQAGKTVNVRNILYT